MTDEHKFQLPDHDREGMDWLLARWHAAKSGDGPPMILSRLRDPRALVSAVGLDADWFHLALTGVPKARTRVKFKEERSNEWSITKAHVDVIASRLVEEHDDALYVMQFDPALRCSAGCVGAAERMNSATGKSYTYLWMSCHCRCGGGEARRADDHLAGNGHRLRGQALSRVVRSCRYAREPHDPFHADRERDGHEVVSERRRTGS